MLKLNVTNNGYSTLLRVPKASALVPLIFVNFGKIVTTIIKSKTTHL